MKYIILILLLLVVGCTAEICPTQECPECPNLYQVIEVNDNGWNREDVILAHSSYSLAYKNDFYFIRGNVFSNISTGVDVYFDTNSTQIGVVIANYTCFRNCDEDDFECMDPCLIHYEGNITRVS